MNKEQLQKQVEEMKLKLAEMEAELNKKEWRSFPQEGEQYWYINKDGSIDYSRKNNLYNACLDLYKTKEEAEKARDIAFARKRLTDRIEELNDGWYPEWSDNLAKYSFYLDTQANIIKTSLYNTSKCIPNNLHMKSRTIAEQILSEMGDDIRLVLGE